VAADPRLPGQLAGGCVETDQIAALLGQQALEPGHTLVVGGNRGQVRVVEPFLQPGLVVVIALPALQRTYLLGQLGKRCGLLLLHLTCRNVAGIQLPQLLAGLREQPDERALLGILLEKFLHQIGMTAGFQPALEARILDCSGERLVEFRIVLHIQQLMGQLVEDDSSQLRIAVTQHAAQHGIGKLPERRVRGHTPDGHIEPARAKPCREGARLPFFEVATVSDTSGDREAPVPGFHRQLACGHHIPDDKGTLDIGVGSIAAIVRKVQLGNREIPSGTHVHEPGAQRRRCVRVGHNLIDRTPCLQNTQLATGRLGNVQRPTAGQCRNEERGKQDSEVRYHVHMEVYLVGGAVRDRLLGLPVRERDWVVVGARPEDLERQGYLPVGREFPVFLHPQPKEEYALARLERKVSPGYKGFITQFSPDVTLEEDLKRRDLTINALAEAPSGEIIDPYGGQQDLQARVLRHVSLAFVEDPVRILRLARFAARFAELGFTVADETLTLMRQMVRDGEIDALVPERVWQETERALGESSPDVFFQTLRECGALAVIFPEIDALYGVPQPARWHPEVDTGIHVMLAIRYAARIGAPVSVRFGVLMHDLGKARTPREHWPSHRGHEEGGVPLVEALAQRLRVPTGFRELAVLAARHHAVVHRAAELRPETVLKLFETTDALRRPDRFAELLLVCESDARGRTGLESRPYPQSQYLRRAREAAAAVQLTQDERAGLEGPAIGAKIRARRLAAVTQVKKDFEWPA